MMRARAVRCDGEVDGLWQLAPAEWKETSEITARGRIGLRILSARSQLPRPS